MLRCHCPQDQLDRIEAKLNRVIFRIGMIMAQLDDLTAAVNQAVTVEDSAIILIQGIATKLAEALAANDPAAVSALVAQLNDKTSALAAAVSANTPAA